MPWRVRLWITLWITCGLAVDLLCGGLCYLVPSLWLDRSLHTELEKGQKEPHRADCGMFIFPRSGASPRGGTPASRAGTATPPPAVPPWNPLPLTPPNKVAPGGHL